MPDELTVAIRAAIARARERCWACQRDAGDPKAVELFGPTMAEVHTCHGDLAIVRDVALAAVEATGHSHRAKGHNRYCPACQVQAKIRELLGSEGGKE